MSDLIRREDALKAIDPGYGDFHAGNYNAIRALPAAQPDADKLVGHMTKLITAGLDRVEQLIAERERLREALLDHNDLLRSAISIAEREGVRGEIASTNWDAYYNRAAVVLKRHHQITTDARAALKGETP